MKAEAFIREVKTFTSSQLKLACATHVEHVGRGAAERICRLTNQTCQDNAPRILKALMSILRPAYFLTPSVLIQVLCMLDPTPADVALRWAREDVGHHSHLDREKVRWFLFSYQCLLA